MAKDDMQVVSADVVAAVTKQVMQSLQTARDCDALAFSDGSMTESGSSTVTNVVDCDHEDKAAAAAAAAAADDDDDIDSESDEDADDDNQTATSPPERSVNRSRADKMECVEYAVERYQSLRQGKSLEEYIANFQRLDVMLDIPDEDSGRHFRAGLSKPVRRLIELADSKNEKLYCNDLAVARGVVGVAKLAQGPTPRIYFVKKKDAKLYGGTWIGEYKK